MGWHFFFGAEHGRSTGQSGGHAPPDAGLLWSRALGTRFILRFKHLPNNTCWRLACVTDMVGGSSLDAIAKDEPKSHGPIRKRPPRRINPASGAAGRGSPCRRRTHHVLWPNCRTFCVWEGQFFGRRAALFCCWRIGAAYRQRATAGAAGGRSREVNGVGLAAECFSKKEVAHQKGAVFFL
jgi:hypothetical protein